MSESPYVEGKLKAGLFEGLTRLQYEQIPALNWSKLSPYLKTHAHGKAAEMRVKDAEWLDIGSALHCSVLRPQDFDNEFGAIPDDAPQKRSNADKLWWANFYQENAGKTMLKPETLADVRLMTRAVYDNPRAKAMLEAPGNKREVVAVWMDPEFGLWCKAQIDLITRVRGVTFIVDLKSGRDISPYGFSGEIAKFNFHGQAAWYHNGCNIVAPFERRFAFIACEKEVGICTVYDADDPLMERGYTDTRIALQRFVEGENAQRWPGYADGYIGLPNWMLKGDR